MKLRVARVLGVFLSLLLSLTPLTVAQTSTQAASALPRIVRFGGTVKDLNGNPLTGVVGITFALYSEQSGGAPLWLETQNVTADGNGHYAVLLGSTKPDGLPADLFISEQARWVGVQVSGLAEQPRVLLVSAPYALKAGDAETIGGLPPSAFVLAAPVNGSSGNVNNGATSSSPSSSSVSPATTSDVTTTGGTVNTIPMFTTATNIQNSILTQTSTTAINVLGKLNLPASGTATASAGFNSRPQDFVASVFNSSTAKAVPQTFQWQAEALNNDKSTATGTLNLLYASGTATLAETGLHIASNGLITFATGQTFPGTGDGTIKGVTAGTDLTGGGTTGTVTLNLNTAKVPLLAAANTFTASQTVKGTLTATTASISNSATINSAAVNPLYVASSSSGGTAIYGFSGAAGAGGTGVYGQTSSSSGSGYGVYGDASAASTGNVDGVYGVTGSPTGVGTFGQNGSLSTTGSGVSTGAGAGVWGDGGGADYGVIGTSDYVAGLFTSNGTEYDTLYVYGLNTNTYPFVAGNSANGTSCEVDPNGDLTCSGTITGVVGVGGGSRKVALSAIESPKNWFEDAGAAELVNGSAVVALDPEFIQTVNTEMEYMVFPVPNGDCKGLYVSHQTQTSFEVHELGGGTSNVRFYYRIMALRKNYENVRFADHTNDPDPRKQMLRRGQAGKRETKPPMAPMKKSALFHPEMVQGGSK
jgi:hypothetical protein